MAMISHAPSPSLASELQPHCGTQQFAPGEVLRAAGHHYHQMFWLTDGAVDVAVDGSGERHSLGPGAPVGEIAFLRGCPATATVTATAPVRALVIDDPTLARLGRERPALVAELMQTLAVVAEDRMSANLVFSPAPPPAGTDAAADEPIVVHLCRSEDMIRSAQELRYQVYCGELGRNSPNADHERHIIADELDRFGHTFIAVQRERTIGTLRGNLPSEGSLGAVEEIYGMTASPKHPARTSVCTKFVIRREHRGGPAAMQLISAMVRFGLRHNVEECYSDCIPALLHYYRALGFRVAGPKFMHRENGPSLPVKVDVARHGHALSEGLKPMGLARIYLLAQAIKWWERARGARPHG
jgi:CRP-like cAMP-binding protein